MADVFELDKIHANAMFRNDDYIALEKAKAIMKLIEKIFIWSSVEQYSSLQWLWNSRPHPRGTHGLAILQGQLIVQYCNCPQSCDPHGDYRRRHAAGFDDNDDRLK